MALAQHSTVQYSSYATIGNYNREMKKNEYRMGWNVRMSVIENEYKKTERMAGKINARTIRVITTLCCVGIRYYDGVVVVMVDT